MDIKCLNVVYILIRKDYTFIIRLFALQLLRSLLVAVKIILEVLLQWIEYLPKQSE